MSAGTATPAPVSVEEWLAAQEREPLLEVVDGEFVVTSGKRNVHHFVAHQLANELQRQWPGTVATAPGNWVLRGDPALGYVPDVLVGEPSMLETGDGPDPVPLLCAEVWSPTNTLRDMERKRQHYREFGLENLVELWVSDGHQVHVEWKNRYRGDWQTVASAVGENALEVAPPHSPLGFAVVPNRLLVPPTA